MQLSVSVNPHTPEMQLLLLTTAGDHLTWVCVCGRKCVSVCVRACVCFVLFLIMLSMISLRGVISLPLRAFHLSGSLCWPPSNCFVCVASTQMKSWTKVFSRPTCSYRSVCVGGCVRQREKDSDRLISIAHSKSCCHPESHKILCEQLSHCHTFFL